MNNGERRISKPTAAIMVSTALFFDLIGLLLNFIPFIGWIIIWILNVIIWLILFFWFKIKGVKYSSKRALNLGGGLLLEMIPILDALPAWTLAVILMIRSSWKEDKESAESGLKAKN